MGLSQLWVVCRIERHNGLARIKYTQSAYYLTVLSKGLVCYIFIVWCCGYNMAVAKYFKVSYMSNIVQEQNLLPS